MQLESYLKRNKIKYVPWALKNGLSPATIFRYLNGRGTIDAKTLIKIEKITDEEVTVMDLIQRYRQI